MRRLKPARLVKTQSDDRFNTVLDFVFVANAPFGWTGFSTILNRDGDQPAIDLDFDDDDEASDHRPVDAMFILGVPAESAVSAAPSPSP